MVTHDFVWVRWDLLLKWGLSGVGILLVDDQIYG